MSHLENSSYSPSSSVQPFSDLLIYFSEPIPMTSGTTFPLPMTPSTLFLLPLHLLVNKEKYDPRVFLAELWCACSANNMQLYSLKLKNVINDDFKGKIGLSGRNDRRAGRSHAMHRRRGRPSPLTETAIRSLLGMFIFLAKIIRMVIFSNFNQDCDFKDVTITINILKSRLEEAMKTASTWLYMSLWGRIGVNKKLTWRHRRK